MYLSVKVVILMASADIEMRNSAFYIRTGVPTMEVGAKISQHHLPQPGRYSCRVP